MSNKIFCDYCDLDITDKRIVSVFEDLGDDEIDVRIKLVDEEKWGELYELDKRAKFFALNDKDELDFCSVYCLALWCTSRKKHLAETPSGVGR